MSTPSRRPLTDINPANAADINLASRGPISSRSTVAEADVAATPAELDQIGGSHETDQTVGDQLFGLALLRSQLVHGALICARAAADATVEGRLPGGPNLRLVPLTNDYDPPLQLLAGIFARKGERQLYADTHPLNLLWDAFTARAKHRAT